MPQLIPYVEEIAREKKRDVLMVVFGKPGASQPSTADFELSSPLKQEHARLTKWLDDNGIGYRCCWNPGYREDGGWLTMPYDETLAIDVPFDPADPLSQKVLAQVELPDGTPRREDVICYVYKYDPAKKAPAPVEDW